MFVNSNQILIMASVIMASVIYGKCYLCQMYYGKCNYGKSIYGKSIMANDTEPKSILSINKVWVELIFLEINHSPLRWGRSGEAGQRDKTSKHVFTKIGLKYYKSDHFITSITAA